MAAYNFHGISSKSKDIYGGGEGSKKPSLLQGNFSLKNVAQWKRKCSDPQKMFENLYIIFWERAIELFFLW